VVATATPSATKRPRAAAAAAVEAEEGASAAAPAPGRSRRSGSGGGGGGGAAAAAAVEEDIGAAAAAAAPAPSHSRRGGGGGAAAAVEADEGASAAAAAAPAPSRSRRGGGGGGGGGGGSVFKKEADIMHQANYLEQIICGGEILEVLPYIGLGPIHLGMDRKAIVELIKSEPVFDKREVGAYSIIPAMDSFNDDGFGLRIRYDEKLNCDYIEAFNSGNEGIKVVMRSNSLFKMNYSDVLKLLRALDPKGVKLLPQGFCSKLFGIIISKDKKGTAPILSVALCKKSILDSLWDL